MITLTTRRLVRPSTVVIGISLLFLLNLVIFTQIVLAQGPAPAKDESMLAQISQLIGVITSVGMLLAAVAAVVWFIWKGKNIEQLTKSMAVLRDDNDDLRAKVSDLRIEKAEALTAKQAAENAAKELKAKHDKEMEEMRKLNFRLQGMQDAE